MATRIVLFGGTFDPVHHGHLITARAVAELCSFERITFIPAASPPHKSAAHAPGAHRLEMLRRATGQEGILDVCSDELDRGGPSYTFDTLMALRSRYRPGEPVHLVIGADMLEDLPHWHRAEEIPDLAEIIIAARPPWQQRLDEIFAALAPRFSPRQIRRLADSVVATPLIDISSSDIRRRVRAGESIRFLVPETVREYINRHRLYAAAS